MFVGKWKYASPEHLGLLPDGQEIDGRADLYSFGIVLYEMLAGRPPYEATTPGQYVILHSKETPNPVDAAQSVVPEAPGLEVILARALEKDREHRYPSAREFARALSALLAKLVESDGEQTAVVRSGSPAGRPATEAPADRTAPIVRAETLLANVSVPPQPPPAQPPLPKPPPPQPPPPQPPPPAPSRAAAPGAPPTPPRAAAPAAQPASPRRLVPTVAEKPRPVDPSPAPRPKWSAARSLAIVSIVAFGVVLAGAGLWSAYKRLTDSTTQQVATTTTTPAATDAAAGVAAGDVTPPATQTAASPEAATTTIIPAPTTIVPAPTPTAPAPTPTVPTTAVPAPTTAVPARPTTVPAPTWIVPVPTTTVPSPRTAQTPTQTPPVSPPATLAKPPAPAVPSATTKAPAASGVPSGDKIPNAGPLGWRSNPLMSSDEWKGGFKRGIIRNYEDLYSGSPADWAAVAPGEQLKQYKVVLGRLANLSGFDNPKIHQSLQTDFQAALDKAAGAKGTVNAQLAVIWAAADPEQQQGIAVEMIFKDAQGRVLAKVRHRAEARSFDGAVDDMLEVLTDFVADHPVIKVK